MPWERAEWTVEAREARRREFMERLFTSENPHKRGALLARGFKVFDRQLTRREFDALARAPHVKKIVVERLDTQAQFISLETAYKTNIWIPFQRSKLRTAPWTGVVPFNATEWGLFCDHVRGWFKYIYAIAAASPAPSSWLFLTSEELVMHEYALRKIYDHLEVPRGQLMAYPPHANRTLPLDTRRTCASYAVPETFVIT
mmetsp:Transcript_15909/g.64133  ORF Transcript_15909/g.64133 Transcript_15909/m.64133 type:complete len:200 (-) Transcript_15909:107-706(-)